MNIADGECKLLTDKLKQYTTKIITSFDLWLDIAKGKANPAQAMMEGKFKVMGDFKIMQEMNNLFAGKRR